MTFYSLLKKLCNYVITHHASRITHHASRITLILLLCYSNSFAQHRPVDTTDAFYDDPVIFSEACYPTMKVGEVSIINFESTSLAFIELLNPDEILVGGNLRVLPNDSEQFYWATPLMQEGYYVLSLEPGKAYELLGVNTCNQLYSAAKIDTRRLLKGDMIPVSEELWSIIRPWKLGEINASLFDYLETANSISEPEKIAFLQNLFKSGAPIPDVALNSMDMFSEIKAFLRDPDPEEGREECFCRVLRITMTSVVTPTSSGAVDPVIHPVPFGPETFKETSKIFMERGALYEGPAKFKSLWGGTKSRKCENSTETGEWGEIKNGETPEESRIRNATGRSRIKVSQLCVSLDGNIGDCYCPQLIRYDYRYDSDAFADTKTMAGVCFNPPGKYSQAMVDDLGLFIAFKEDFDPTSPTFGEREILATDAVRNLVASSCERDFNEGVILDILQIGFGIYGYSKGLGLELPGDAAEVDWGDVAANLGETLYANYKASQVFDKLDSLLQQPWVVGDCGIKNVSVSMDSTGSVTLNDYEELTFELFEVSNLRIKGRTRWRATAEVSSGFSLAAALFERASSGHGNDCCTRPAGIFNYSSYHPLEGAETYTQEIGELFAAPLGAYFPQSGVNGQVLIDLGVERGILVPPSIPELNCDTQINGRGKSTNNSDKSGYIQTDAMAYFDGSDILLNRKSAISKDYSAQLWSVDGRLILNAEGLSTETDVIFRNVRYRTRSGIYILRLFDEESTRITQKIMLP